MKYGLFAALLACAITSVHAESEWSTIAVSAKENMRLDVQRGSLEFSATNLGEAIAVLNGRTTDTRTSRVVLYKWYVSAADCAEQKGKVVSLNIDGIYQFENEFAIGDGSFATSMAEAICGAADSRIKRHRR